MDHLPSTTENTERQAFFPIVRIWSSHPLTRKKVLLLPSLDPRGRHTRWEGGGGGPNSDEEPDILVFYVQYILIPLRPVPSKWSKFYRSGSEQIITDPHPHIDKQKS